MSRMGRQVRVAYEGQPNMKKEEGVNGRIGGHYEYLIFCSHIFKLFEFYIFVTPHGNALQEGFCSFLIPVAQQRVPRRCWPNLEHSTFRDRQAH